MINYSRTSLKEIKTYPQMKRVLDMTLNTKLFYHIRLAYLIVYSLNHFNFDKNITK